MSVYSYYIFPADLGDVTAETAEFRTPRPEDNPFDYKLVFTTSFTVDLAVKVLVTVDPPDVYLFKNRVESSLTESSSISVGLNSMDESGSVDSSLIYSNSCSNFKSAISLSLSSYSLA